VSSDQWCVLRDCPSNYTAKKTPSPLRGQEKAISVDFQSLQSKDASDIG
jgi:hypothetical protein